MKLCKDCKHAFVEDMLYVCKKRVGHYNYVTGEHLYPLCETNRSHSHFCGPKAEWFEPKDGEKEAPIKSLWQSLWNP